MRSRSLRCKNLEVYATAIVMGLPAAGLLVTVFALSSHLLYLALRFSPLLLFGYVLTLPLIGGMLLLGRPVVHALCAPLEITCNEHYLEVRCLLRRVRMSANAITAVYTENAITDHPWFDHLWLWRSRWVYDTWILPADGWVCLQYEHRSRPAEFRFAVCRLDDLTGLAILLREFNPSVSVRGMPGNWDAELDKKNGGAQ